MCIIENLVLIRFLKIIGVKNQLPISSGTDLASNKILKVRNFTPTHTSL